MAKTKLLLLIKANRRQSSFLEQLGISSATARKPAKPINRAKKITATALIIAALFVGFGSLMVMLGANYRQLELIGSFIGIKGLSLFMGSLIAAVVTFTYATYTAGSMLYRANDLKMLVTLPVNENDLFVSRFILHYLTNISLYVAVMIPALFVIAITYGFSFRIISMGLLVLLIGPVLPISLSMLYARLFATTGRNGGKRRYTEVIALFVMFILLVGLQSISSRWLREGFSETTIANLAAMFGNLFSTLFKWFPLASWKTRMIVPDSVASMLRSLALFVILSGSILFVSIAFGKQNYSKLLLQSISESNGTRTKRKKNSIASYEAPIHYRSPIKVLVMKEFVLINSQNSYMMELYAEAAIPLILVIVYFIGGTLGDVAAMVNSLSSSDAFPFMYCGVLLAMATISMMSSTSISREGRLFDFSKILPVSPNIHVKAKVLAHLLLFGSTYLIFMIIGLFFLPVSPVHLLWMIPLGWLLITLSSFTSLAIDYSRPRLEWKLPQQAVKQNMNGMLGMIVSLITIAIFAGIMYVLLIVLGLHAIIVGISLVVVSALSLIPAWKVVVKAAGRCYAAA